MKKISLFAVVILFVALAMSSCKSTEDCPAYSSTQTELEAERA